MPQRRKHLTDLATRHQVLLERLKAGEARRIVAGIDELERATVGIVAALRKETGQLTRKELTQVLAYLKKTNGEVLDKVAVKMMDRMEDIAVSGAEAEQMMLKAVLPASISVAIPKAGVAFATALANPLSATGQFLDDFVKNWTSSEINRINNVIRRGWGEGWTNQQVIQSIRGTRALKFRDGILTTTRRNAEAVTRTSIQHIASAGRAATWEANKDIVEGYRYVATLDAVTTQICRSLDGQEFKLGRGPMPPVHINCRSTTVAVVDKALGLDFLDEGATRSSKDGYVDANLNYYDWLKTQPKSFQIEALGKTRAKLFSDGGLSADKFAKLNLGRNFQPLTLEQMRAKAPSVFDKAGIPPKP